MPRFTKKEQEIIRSLSADARSLAKLSDDQIKQAIDTAKSLIRTLDDRMIRTPVNNDYIAWKEKIVELKQLIIRFETALYPMRSTLIEDLSVPKLERMAQAIQAELQARKAAE